MQEHGERLGEFLSQDTRGKQLPDYLRQLASSLQNDQSTSIKHLDALQHSVEHIKRIVAMQQTLAKVSAVEEEVDLAELFEASLQMNTEALERHHVKVAQEFEAVPRVVLDKHGVLQILVNLISNAKHACNESGHADKRITLRMQRREDTVELSVSDNGVGIAAENLTRIFRHGFTTRASGHGFGLNSSAQTAKQLGGALRVHSDGLGLGATFTLVLPLDAAEAQP
jgi:signal transduction histidine kinase